MQCFLCKSPATPFLDLGKQPLANKYPTLEEIDTEEFFPLQVFFCQTCKNVQLGTVISRERMFQDYYYLSSVNMGLVRHFQELAQKLSDAHFVVDIGSNDGILLKPLKDLGVRAIGVDPSVNVSKLANDEGLTTLVSFFDSAVVQDIVEEYGKADVLVASSIFTHVEDPHQFIEDAKSLMSDDGRLIIEAEYIGNILDSTQFERFYLDRVFYYSLTSLKHLFEEHGMHVSDVEKIEPHGGSLRVTVKKGLSAEDSPSIVELLAEEAASLDMSRLMAFKKGVDEQMAVLRSKLEEYKKEGLRVAGYGAPARVATICNYGNINSDLIEYIVDDSPLKQNRHSPGTHIPIVHNAFLEGNRPDVLVVFAHEYFDDIKKKTGGKYRYLLPVTPLKVV